MARFNGRYEEGFVFETEKEKIEFTDRSRVRDPLMAISLAADAAGARLELAGKITSDGDGIDIWAPGANVTIERSGRIDAYHGVQMLGTDQSMTNHGEIHAEGYGVLLTRSDDEFLNKGLISAGIGVSVQSASDNRFVNEASGRIVAESAGVIVTDLAGEITKMINRGSIVSTGTAVLGGESNDQVINRGKIGGSIDLGGGNDTFDGRGGTLKGTVSGSYGDDQYYIDDRRVEIVEEQNRGFDYVSCRFGYRLPDNVEGLYLMGKKNVAGHGNDGVNNLVGNRGDNVLIGHGGGDYLMGSTGNDRLVGGDGEDTFHFQTGDGTDTIVDFVDGTDRLFTTYWSAFEDGSDMIDHARDVKGDVIIKAGHDRLVIKDFTTDQLDLFDFVLT